MQPLDMNQDTMDIVAFVRLVWMLLTPVRLHLSLHDVQELEEFPDKLIKGSINSSATFMFSTLSLVNTLWVTTH